MEPKRVNSEDCAIQANDLGSTKKYVRAAILNEGQQGNAAADGYPALYKYVLPFGR
ncbi:hypothetical protein Aglo01_41520 [Actinokineospora globicatena]|nr:hypothetical protein Aglo01_41520 [Actinokineospora globicatena]GLW85919.1 hypothetical protein Aglo02_35590 [Actinokineospora globicatena]